MTIDAQDRPILVSGCPRSGTTWMGSIISASPDIFSVYEPFNTDAPAHLSPPERFYAASDHSPVSFVQDLEELMSLGKLSNRTNLAARGVLQYKHEKRKLAPRLAARQLKKTDLPFFSPKRVCIKDPIAFYSAEWMAERYTADVVMMLRHPCGVVSSYLALDWPSEIDAMLERKIPKRLEQQVADFKNSNRNHLDALIMQWNIFTALTLEYRRTHPDWTFVIHDRLCQDPLAEYEYVYKRIGLDFASEVQAKVLEESDAKNMVDPGQHEQHVHKRASKMLVEAWRDRLDPVIADQVLRGTEELWQEALAEFSELTV